MELFMWILYGNRIYSSDVLDDRRRCPRQYFLISIRYIWIILKTYISIFVIVLEVVNGLSWGWLLFLPIEEQPFRKSRFVVLTPSLPASDFDNKFKDTYISFAPRVRVEWTLVLLLYEWEKRKINLRSVYPTYIFLCDYERGM